MQEEILDPFTGLPRISNVSLLTEINRQGPPPAFDWKPGDSIDFRLAVPPPYQP